jgi:PhnB protein
MRISTHLMFDGNCEDAFTFYARVFGGTLQAFRYAGSPMADQAPPGWGDKIMHATLSVGDQELAGADVATYQRPQGFAMMINPETPERAAEIFSALAEGGTVVMSLQETFWSPAFGVVTDRFGIQWEINYETAA